MSSSNNDMMNALLDSELDDLDDLPEFKTFPAGSYVVSLELTSKVINNEVAIEANFKCKEVLELADTNTYSADVPKQGDETSVLFVMTNEFGAGKFKKLGKVIGDHFGVTKNRAIIEATKGGIEVVAVLKQRPNKDKTATYQELVSVSII